MTTRIDVEIDKSGVDHGNDVVNLRQVVQQLSKRSGDAARRRRSETNTYKQ